MRCGNFRLSYLPLHSTQSPLSSLFYPLLCTPQDGGEQITVSSEYLTSLRFALQTERRRVEELEKEALFLRAELAKLKVRDVAG